MIKKLLRMLLMFVFLGTNTLVRAGVAEKLANLQGSLEQLAQITVSSGGAGEGSSEPGKINVVEGLNEALHDLTDIQKDIQSGNPKKNYPDDEEGLIVWVLPRSVIDKLQGYITQHTIYRWEKEKGDTYAKFDEASKVLWSKLETEFAATLAAIKDVKAGKKSGSSSEVSSGSSKFGNINVADELRKAIVRLDDNLKDKPPTEQSMWTSVIMITELANKLGWTAPYINKWQEIHKNGYKDFDKASQELWKEFEERLKVVAEKYKYQDILDILNPTQKAQS